MIDFSLRTDHPSNTKADAVAVAVHEGQKLSWGAQELDKASKGAFAAAIKAASFSGRAGSVLPLFNLPGVAAARVIAYGVGEGKSLTAKDARSSGRAIAASANEQSIADVAIFPLGEGAVATMSQMVLGVSDAMYRFDETKGAAAKAKAEKPSLKRVRFGMPEGAKDSATALKNAVGAAHGIEYAKYLGNLPPNHCTPTRLGEEA
ncbi:MAG: M17 family peptidase N-terminal domain-containing protein, partial [Casimicrobium sp.]